MSTTLKKREAIGEQIAEFEAQLADPAHANMSRAELHGMLAAQVEQWHDHAVDLIANDLATLAGGGYANLLVSPTTDRGHEEDVRAFMTFAVGKTEMLKRFEPLLADLPEGRDAAARARHLAEIKAELVKLEVREEALLRDADEQGIAWTPRPGQRPEATILIGYGK